LKLIIAALSKTKAPLSPLNPDTSTKKALPNSVPQSLNLKKKKKKSINKL
jgi:hypothetical protein